jgi:glyoxylase-like metal-dependent hydrolase (beta-lactamase superfamily II)
MERTVTARIGDVAITPVWDGTLDANIEGVRGLDPGVARELIAAERAVTGWDPLVLPVRAFLVTRGSRKMLVDAGSGTTKGPSMGLLPASLAKLDVTPADIDALVMTHIHMDHAGGLTDASGAAIFPRAELVMHEAEGAYFLDTPAEQLDARSQRNVAAQRRIVAAYQGRVRRVADGADVGGLVAMLAPGHTPGHTAWIARGDGRQAMVIGDVVHLGAVQLPRPDTAMIYDVDSKRAAETRRRVLAKAADERILVAGAHLPAPGLGYIRRDGDAYRFEPMS